MSRKLLQQRNPLQRKLLPRKPPLRKHKSFSGMRRGARNVDMGEKRNTISSCIVQQLSLANATLRLRFGMRVGRGCELFKLLIVSSFVFRFPFSCIVLLRKCMYLCIRVIHQLKLYIAVRAISIFGGDGLGGGIWVGGDRRGGRCGKPGNFTFVVWRDWSRDRLLPSHPPITGAGFVMRNTPPKS